MSPAPGNERTIEIYTGAAGATVTPSKNATDGLPSGASPSDGTDSRQRLSPLPRGCDGITQLVDRGAKHGGNFRDRAEQFSGR